MTCICGVSFLLSHLCGLWGPKWGHQVCVACTFILQSLLASLIKHCMPAMLTSRAYTSSFMLDCECQSESSRVSQCLFIFLVTLFGIQTSEDSLQPFFTHFLTSPAMFWELRSSFWSLRAHLVIRKICSLAMKFFIVCCLIFAHWTWCPMTQCHNRQFFRS